MNPTRILSTATLLLIAPGCWSTSVAADDVLKPPDRPRVTDKPREELPKWLRNPDETEVYEDDDSYRSIYQGPVLFHVRLGVARIPLLADRATVRIDLPVGHAESAIGLSELAALVVADTADTASNRPSLRTAITRLGGDLAIEVGAGWTRFTATVPKTQWEQALFEIGERLREQPVTRVQFSELQDRLVRDHLEQWDTRPTLSHASQWIRHGDLKRSAIIAGIQDRHIAEVQLFRKRYHQPTNVTVGIWVSEVDDPAEIVDRAKGALRRWAKQPQPPEATPKRQRPPAPRGVRWVEADGPTRIALILPIIPSMEHYVLLETLTMDGLGGRLGASIERSIGREVVFQVHRIGNYNDQHVVLEAAVQPDKVAEVFAAATAAWNSIGKAPPTGDELRAAVRRARLRLAQRQDQPDRWFEAYGVRALRRDTGGPIRDLKDLSELRKEQLAAQRNTWSKAAIAMVVHGGEFPETTDPLFQKYDASPPKYEPPTVIEEGSSESSETHLKRAVSALGDVHHFLTYRGYASTEEWEDSSGLKVEARTVFDPPRTLRREMRVLQTRIKIEIKGREGTETVKQRTRQLTAGEAAELRQEVNRHPIALLAGWTQKTIKFRVIGDRTRSGRAVVLLERVDTSLPRLRLTIDKRSGLIRTVETIQRRPDVGFVEVREAYSDYRRTDGVRIPMHRVTTIGDDPDGVESTVQSFMILRR